LDKRKVGGRVFGADATAACGGKADIRRFAAQLSEDAAGRIAVLRAAE